LQGRLTYWSTGNIDSRTYAYDLNGNVTGINTNIYGFDWLDRLTSAPAASFSYDGNGNRTADSSGAYTYAHASNRMATAPPGSVTLDAAGNTTNVGSKTYTYNQAGRLATASSAGTLLGQYTYSFDGHRAAKTASGATTIFHYGVHGELIAETDSAGNTLKEYVWDDDGRPVAQFAAGVITYLHADHLSTPRFGTDATRAVVWQWGDQTFGTGPPSGSVTVNLRYAGQYFDQETGLFQNWHRTYDPESGRYLESDPLGISAGLNTFGYVGGNPLRFTDREGLAIDILPDIGFIGYDLYRIVKDNLLGSCGNFRENATALGADVLGAAIPGVTGLGLAVRAAGKEARVVKGSLWTSTKSKSAVENAFGHWKKHKVEFPEFQNAKQYVEGTQKFLNSPPKGTLSKSGSNGDTLLYNPKTNTFGVKDANGAPRTMFRPKDGMDYWNKQ